MGEIFSINMKSTIRPQYKLAELVQGLNATIKGNPDCLITGISTIQQSSPGHITFLNNSLYRKHLVNTQASAVILSDEYATDCPVNAVISSDPYYTYAKIAAFFDEVAPVIPGVHPTTVVEMGAKIDSSASVGANCFIGKCVKIAARVVISPGCYLGDFVEIDEDTQLDANVTLYHDVKVGKRTRISAGVVIGSDGFGFANQKSVWHKVPQLGSVLIGDDVDIGANTTIDRGAIENTVIEDGVKLDNLIQVGHNVRIGAHTVIAGCVGIAGSADIGKHCIVGGATNFAGHIKVCDNVLITGSTNVNKSIHEPGIYSSGIIGVVPNQEFRKNNARFHRLENLIERVKTLESTIKKLAEGTGE